MKFSRNDAQKQTAEGLSYWVYNTKMQFSGASAAYFELTASHGLTRSTVSDRVYYVVDGHGEFIMGHDESGHETIQVGPTDVVIVPRNTEYDYWASSGETLKLFMVHAPAFDPDGEIRPDR
jgi:mannose-6-phosphate isomerase-like protein (cupin superfamily)